MVKLTLTQTRVLKHISNGARLLYYFSTYRLHFGGGHSVGVRLDTVRRLRLGGCLKRDRRRSMFGFTISARGRRALRSAAAAKEG